MVAKRQSLTTVATYSRNCLLCRILYPNVAHYGVCACSQLFGRARQRISERHGYTTAVDVVKPTAHISSNRTHEGSNIKKGR